MSYDDRDEGIVDPMQLAIETAFPSAGVVSQQQKMVSRYPPDVINPQVALAVVGRRMGSKVIPMIIEEYSAQRISVDGLGREDLIALMGIRVPEGEEGEGV